VKGCGEIEEEQAKNRGREDSSVTLLRTVRSARRVGYHDRDYIRPMEKLSTRVQRAPWMKHLNLYGTKLTGNSEAAADDMGPPRPSKS